MARTITPSPLDGLWEEVAPRMLQHAPSVICDAAGTVLMATDEFCRITGHPRATLTGRNYGAIVRDGDPARYFDDLARIIAREGAWKGEIAMRGGDGSPRWLHTIIVGLSGEGNAAKLYLAHHVDMTATRQLLASERSLREEVGLWGTAIESFLGQFFYIGEDGRLLKWNRRVEMLTGCSPEEIVHMDVSEFFAEEDRALITRRVGEAFEKGRAEVEATLVHKDGRRFPHRFSAAVIEKDGRKGLVGLSIDISERRDFEAKLRQELDFSNAMLNSLPGIFYQHDAEGRLMRWNRNHLGVTGYSEADYATMNALDFFREEDRARVVEAMAGVMADNGEAFIEADFVTSEGRAIPYLFTGVALNQSDPPSFVGIGIDISAQKETEEALLEKSALLEAQLESTIDGILVVDLNGRGMLHNQRILDLLKVPADRIEDAGERPSAIAARVTNPAQFLARAARLMDHPEETGRDEIEMTDGVVLDRHTAPVRGKDGRIYGRIWVYRDITEAKRAQNHIRHLAHYDALTDLANRHSFQQHLGERLAHDRSGFALLYVDLDGFKLINDTKGHAVGDELLRRVAERLRGACSGPDMFVARLGGDEFACLIPHLDTGATMDFAAALIGKLSAPYWLDADRQLLVGASIGIALAPEHGDEAGQILSRADIALYAAKAAGKGIARLFAPEMERRVQARMHLESDLRAALEGQDGLFVFYQPIVDIHTGRVTAREALARWHHAERGWVSPSEFVPAAEIGGLIDRLGNFVLDKACHDAVQWEDGACVAVNVSAAQLGKGILVPAIRAALDRSGLAPGRLEIEVTETALLANEEETIEELRAVREIGVHVALDDFGTGYSSLSHIRLFPFDKIKIDGSFVRDALERPDCAAVVRAVADLGRRLGVKTVAEGVETEAHLECIRAEGCTEVQGYVYGRPAPMARDAATVATLGRSRSAAA